MPDVNISDAITTAEAVTLSGVPNPNVSDAITVAESASVSLKPRLTIEYYDTSSSAWYEITQHCPIMGDVYLGLPPVRTEAVRESNTGIARFSLNETGAALVSEGTEIRITDGDGLYFFGGYIARVEEMRRAVETGAICDCQDYNSLMDRTIVVNYTIDNGDTDSTEIGTLRTTYLSEISTGQVDTLNASMEQLELLGTFRDSLAKIAGQVGGDVHYWIDFEKKLYYVESRQDVAGKGGNVTLSDVLGGSNEQYGDTRKITDNTRKVDRVYVVGDGVEGWVGSGEYEAIISDSRITTAQGVTDLGNTITSTHGSATEEYRVTTWVKEAYSEFYLTFAHSDFHSSGTIDVRRATMTPRNQDGTEFTITLDLGEWTVDTDSIGGNSSRGVMTPGGSRGRGVDISVGSPDDAQYVTMALNADLSAERVLTAGDGLDLTDGGANGNATVAVDVTDIIGNGITESSNNIVLGTPSTLSVSTSNGVTASSHTHTITTSDNPGAAASILATNASGNITLEDIYVDEYIWHTGDTDTSIQFLTDRITIDAGGVAMLDIVEAATNYIDVGARLRLGGNSLYFDSDNDSYMYSSADDEIDVVLGGNRQYNFDHDQLTIYNTSGTSKVYIRTHGGTQTIAADIYAEEFAGLAAEESTIIFIDAANNGTGDRFAIMRNGENVSAATEVMRVQENGLMGLNASSPSGILDVRQTSTTGAAPVAYLRQADVSEEFILYRGTAANGVLTRSLVDYGDESSSTAAVWIKCYVIDDGNQVADQAYYILAYTLA